MFELDSKFLSGRGTILFAFLTWAVLEKVCEAYEGPLQLTTHRLSLGFLSPVVCSRHT